MGILFTHGQIATAEGVFPADLLIEGEKIAQIGLNLPQVGHTLINIEGKYLLPGGVDVHTHFALPVSGTTSSDDFTTGGIAAAFGGTTTHLDFAIQSKGESLRAALDQWQAKAYRKAVIDYSLHMTITDLTHAAEVEIPLLLEAGIPSLKLLMAYKGSVQVDDETLFRVMQIAAHHNMLVMTHCENGDTIYTLQQQALKNGHVAPIHHALTRPAALEAEATQRAIALAEVAGCKLYVVHITCAGALEAVYRARRRGLPVMGETCVQYLFLTESALDQPDFEGAKYVCSPPLRTANDNIALWQALREGTLQVLSTDHCPFWFEGGVDGRSAGKELGRAAFTKIPNGVPSVEERLKLTWHYGVNAHRIDIPRFVAINCTNPARIFNLYPRKGALIPGADADVVVWNPHKSGQISAAQHHMQVDYSIFEGYPVLGLPETVFLRGQKIVDGDTWLGTTGSGQFLPRSAGAPMV